MFIPRCVPFVAASRGRRLCSQRDETMPKGNALMTFSIFGEKTHSGLSVVRKKKKNADTGDHAGAFHVRLSGQLKSQSDGLGGVHPTGAEALTTMGDPVLGTGELELKGC